ncbi:TadE/TadG family type IV pilus assembly protein [Botrimarina sp.]|uniref:TadE/TadG family type IV pilus assembly protein n=1 Tax=Botrimarina sp. TaxID=2795802 RepID=UPI0032EFB525
MAAQPPIRRRRPPAQQRTGAAAVEFAIVAPLFFMMVLGCIEIGRALMVQQVLVNASRVGAREAATLTGTGSSAQTAAVNYAAGASVPGVAASVAPDPTTAEAGDLITVRLSVDFADVSWSPTPWFLSGTTLEAQSVMRKEGFK